MNAIDQAGDQQTSATELTDSRRGSQTSGRRFVLGIAIAALAGVMVSGCGFHLRGKVALSKNLTPLAISGSDEGLVAVLKDALAFSGTPVVDDTASAQAVLRLIRANVRRTVRTTDNRGLATAYRLHYRVRYEVVNRAGEVIVKSARLSQTRDLDFDSSQILTKEDEQRFLIEDMQRDIAQSILRSLTVLASLDSKATPRLAAAKPMSPDAG